jgi:glucose/arabinose dehydrogenase
VLSHRLCLWLTFGALALAAAPAAAITTSPGFRVETVARGVPQPAAIAFDADGRMWATSAGNGATSTNGVWFVPKAGPPRKVVGSLFLALGLTWHDGELFVTHVTPFDDSAAAVPRRRGQVTAFSGFDGRRFTTRRVVVKNLPVGRHTIDAITPGPDGRLYVGNGSRFDSKAAPDRLSAVVFSMDPSGADLRVEARGLRNPYGLAFIPGTSDLVVTENGRDDLGPDTPPDEVNLVRTSGPAPFLGFPRCWGIGRGRCGGTSAPLVETAPHSSTDGIAAATRFGRFGLSAYVANNGSSFTTSAATSNVQRVALTKTATGYRARLKPFASEFRKFDPLGLAFGPDGNLYLTLYTSGRIVRFVPR